MIFRTVQLKCAIHNLIALSVMFWCTEWMGIAKSQSGHESIHPFLRTYCATCHDGKSTENQFNVDGLSWEATDESVKRLTAIWDRVQSLEMPPSDGEQPSNEERSSFLSAFGAELGRLDSQRISRDGRAMLRRLNRYEYESSLRDLFVMPWLSIRDSLPEDGELYRYNKVGQALDVSHVQLSRYMSVATNVMQQAVAAKFRQSDRKHTRFYARDEFSLIGNFWPRENGTLPDRLSFPVLDSHAQPDVRNGSAPKSSPETREREAVGKVSSIFSDAGGYSWSQFRAPTSGRYKLRFKGYSIWVSGGGMGRWFYEGFGDQKIPLFHVPLWHRPNADEIWPGQRAEPIGVYAQSSGKSRFLGAFDFNPEPTECEIETILVAGEVVQTDGMRLFRTRVNGTDEQYINPLATESGMPGYAIQWMEVDGPLESEPLTAGYELLFDELPVIQLPPGASTGFAIKLSAASPPSNLVSPPSTSPERTPPLPRRGFGGPRLVDVRVDVVTDQPIPTAKRLIQRFLKRAYGREAESQDLDRFVELFERQFQKEGSFANALVTTYTAILASPGFLFLDENPGPLSSLALANRLSLFLWNSKPDEELYRLAECGELAKPTNLRDQVNRMLDHPNSRRFVEAFTDYWLDLRKIDDTSPSTTLYNDYELDEPLKAAAIEETRLFVANLFAEDLSVKTIVDSDFTYLNQRLALHYGIQNVNGVEMRRIQLPSDSIRGGLITQASVLKVTANGTTTSPVIRGNWISERILGVRISPPPSVPAVEPDIRGAVTIRQQLEKHRESASCARCHAKIDPPGLALEAFDVMGGFRQQYRAVDENKPAVKGIGLNGQSFVFHFALPVDCSGSLEDGSTFHDVRELRHWMLKDERRLARNFVHQLIIYSTGAPISFSDRPKVEHILEETAESQYGLRSLVHAIVQSELFLNK